MLTDDEKAALEEGVEEALSPGSKAVAKVAAGGMLTEDEKAALEEKGAATEEDKGPVTEGA